MSTEGIDWEASAPYTPQQNGVAERFNRSVMEMARSMLRHAGLPHRFWAEAVVTATRIMNTISCDANNGMTPHQVLTGTVPNLESLRTFGCEVWIHVAKRKKLEKKARRGILLRSLPHLNYRVYDIERREVKFARHVTINEDVLPGRLLFSSGRESGRENTLDEVGGNPAPDLGLDEDQVLIDAQDSEHNGANETAVDRVGSVGN